jgi:hypothetical protein
MLMGIPVSRVVLMRVAVVVRVVVLMCVVVRPVMMMVLVILADREATAGQNRVPVRQDLALDGRRGTGSR